MMYAPGNNLVSFLEEFAPAWKAMPGDPEGLQWGDLSASVHALLLSLDFSEEVLEEALLAGANFVLTHHPFLYRPLQRIDFGHKPEALVARAIKEEVTLFAAHTSLDVSSRGVSQALGELLGLRDMQVLRAMGRETMEKLVVFVPEGYEDKVREAISEAGAGWVGNYSHCTFQVRGTGTFLPGEGSSPFIGRQGTLEKVKEYRLETIVPRSRRRAVLEALFNAHPYEEVAYDLYPLSIEGKPWGFGRVGWLKEKTSLGELVEKIRCLLASPGIKVWGKPDQKVEKVALLGGSGGDYLENALNSGADLYLTGEVRYHDGQKALSAGMALVEVGHDCSERPVLPVLAEFLQEKIRERGYQTKVLISRTSSPWWCV